VATQHTVDPDGVVAPLSSVWSRDPPATADLLPLVYDELRNLAAPPMAAEAPGEGGTCRREIRENAIF
jgi:hypothetical protein